MMLTTSPWPVRLLSVEEMLTLCALHYLTPLLDELRTAYPDIFTLMVAQRVIVAEIAKRSGLSLPETLAVLRALERKHLATWEGADLVATEKAAGQ